MENVLNMLDYIAWRGDLPLTADGFNEADGAVLARFAYIPFEYFQTPPTRGLVTIRALAEQSLADGSLDRDGRWKLRDRELMAALAGSRRFGELEAGWYFNRFDEALQTQFSAITVKLSPDVHLLAFRGTDNTIVGWKEDLNMSYLCPIPGQKTAAAYAKAVAERVDGRLMFCGHSKGGNLAVYAGAFCGEPVQARLDAVYNYDGPGFFDDILESPGYRAVCGRIRTFIPQFSVVGMLLGREDSSAVVHSGENGLHQHDMYSWELRGPRFIKLGTVTGGSKFVNSALKGWIAEMTPEQFELFADAIYKIMEDTNARTLHQMRENLGGTVRSIAHSVGDMDESTRRAVVECVKLLLVNAGRGMKEELRERGSGEKNTFFPEKS